MKKGSKINLNNNKKIDADYDETRGGQQILATLIKTSNSEKEKEALIKRKLQAIERKKEKTYQKVVLLGKECRICKEIKSSDNFHTHSKRQDKLQDTCISCREKVNKEYYKNTPEKNIARQAYKTRRMALVRKITTPIELLGCVDCGQYYENAMDFDHVRGIKVSNISSIYQMRVSDDEMVLLLKEELKKCEVRCVNCHRIVTMERHAKNHRLMFIKDPRSVPLSYRYVYGLLSIAHCIDCNNSDFRVLEYDHVSGEKKFSIGRVIDYNFEKHQIDKEISKCEVRCAKCHRQKSTARARKVESTKQIPYVSANNVDLKCSCGKDKRFQSNICATCVRNNLISWPDVQSVIIMIKEANFVQVGKKLGVSDNAIRKFLKRNGIDPKTLIPCPI